MRRSWFATLWTCWWGGWTVVMLFMAVAQWTGLDPARDDDAALGGMIVAIVTGAMTLAGVLMSRRRDDPVPGLTDAETVLAALLDQLRDRPDLMPAGVADRARRTAAAAAVRIRVVAARIDTVERLLPNVSPREQATFEDGIGSLRPRLDQALDAYGTLVADAERVLLTGTDELVTATDRLADATEALREVSAVDRR